MTDTTMVVNFAAMERASQSIQTALSTMQVSSTGSTLMANVTDVVGLYLNPPERAMVLCVHAERTAPSAI